MPNKIILSLAHYGCPFEDLKSDQYRLMLCVGSADKYMTENDSAIIFESTFKRDTDEEAINVAKRVAKRIGCFLDLDRVGGDFVYYAKDLDCD